MLQVYFFKIQYVSNTVVHNMYFSRLKLKYFLQEAIIIFNSFKVHQDL